MATSDVAFKAANQLAASVNSSQFADDNNNNKSVQVANCITNKTMKVIMKSTSDINMLPKRERRRRCEIIIEKPTLRLTKNATIKKRFLHRDNNNMLINNGSNWLSMKDSNSILIFACITLGSFLCCLNGPSSFVEADIFSSTSHLQNLMYLERHLITSLGEYVVQMEQRLNKIRSYIDNWEATAGRDEFVGTFSEDAIIGNPLQAFQLVKRLTIDWRSISDLFKQDQWNEVKRLTQDYKELMPVDDDLHGAALAIVRLQDTYNLTESELAMGKIQEHATRVEMTARDCLYLAKHAFNNAYYDHSLDWFQEAMRRAYIEGNTTASINEIAPFFQMASQVVEQFRKETNGASLDTYHIYMEASGSREHSTKFKMLDDDNEDYRKYQALCRGEKKRTPAQEAPLKCYLRHNNHPLLYIQPIKLEVHNIKPFISVIHNLMTVKEAKIIRELAAPQLSRARVQTDNGTADMVSKTRTSQTAWFAPDTHPIVERISRRIEAATGLSADMTDSHCELMQVANYGMGGHYTPHYDYLIVDRPKEERDQVDDRELYAGDRTATVMFYLKDVVRGGSTVFSTFRCPFEGRNWCCCILV